MCCLVFFPANFQLCFGTSAKRSETSSSTVAAPLACTFLAAAPCRRYRASTDSFQLLVWLAGNNWTQQKTAPAAKLKCDFNRWGLWGGITEQQQKGFRVQQTQKHRQDHVWVLKRERGRENGECLSERRVAVAVVWTGIDTIRVQNTFVTSQWFIYYLYSFNESHFPDWTAHKCRPSQEQAHTSSHDAESHFNEPLLMRF